MRKSLAMWASKVWLVWARSRRAKLLIKPSMAEVATPATEVPKARPKPLMGSEKAARIPAMLLLPSSANTAPLSVTTMPKKVPSMPNMTSSPTRYGVSAGPGRATRSPSTRRRTGLCKAAGRRTSQSLRLSKSCGMSLKAWFKASVAWRYCCSSRAPITYTAPITAHMNSTNRCEVATAAATQRTASAPSPKAMWKE